MNRDFSSNTSMTDWDRVRSMKDEDIDLSDIPQITEEQMNRAVLRVGGKPVDKGKVRVNMYLDTEIVAHFKDKAGGRGYQTLINEALKETLRAEDIETVMRRVVREELAVAAA